MRISVCIPDKLFRAAETVRGHLKMSRSRLYATALEEFVATDQASKVTERLNSVYGKAGSRLDGSMRRLQARSFHQEKWS